MKGEGRPRAMMAAGAGLAAIAAALRIFGNPALPPEFNRGPKAPEYRIHRRSKNTHGGRRRLKREDLDRLKEQSDREFVLSLGGRRSLRPFKLRGINRIPESEVEAARAELARLDANG